MRFKLGTLATKELYEAKRKRIKTRFLWFPKKINREIRWLEKTAWVQEIDCNVKFYDWGLTKVTKYYWRDVEWLDKNGIESDDEDWLED